MNVLVIVLSNRPCTVDGYCLCKEVVYGFPMGDHWSSGSSFSCQFSR